MVPFPRHAHAWPSLPWEEWRETAATLHRWTQIVGKVRLERTPWVNHSWHVPLYVTPRGLTTSAIPGGDRVLEMELDFLDHRLEVRASDGGHASVELGPRSVADFYGEVMERLEGLGLKTDIHTTPQEIPDPHAVPFPEDEEHAAYDAEAVERFHRVLVAGHRVFQRFRARFIGKSSPVHFFWGSFDLAVTRFSGREAPEHPAGIPNMPDWVAREAYSHEVSSLGFWPGGEPLPEPVFYAYAYPSPEGFDTAEVGPDAAYWHGDLGEWVLPWEAVRRAEDPEETLLRFAQDSYEAAAQGAGWDREALEWPDGRQGPPELEGR